MQAHTSHFTVATVDNINFMQSHAAVYSGDQSENYHGTNIKGIQPVPSMKLSTGICSVTSDNFGRSVPSVACAYASPDTQDNLYT